MALRKLKVSYLALTFIIKGDETKIVSSGKDVNFYWKDEYENKIKNYVLPYKSIDVKYNFNIFQRLSLIRKIST